MDCVGGDKEYVRVVINLNRSLGKLQVGVNVIGLCYLHR
jgi:hypothetical protein